jgi:hypothetical protein
MRERKYVLYHYNFTLIKKGEAFGMNASPGHGYNSQKRM